MTGFILGGVLIAIFLWLMHRSPYFSAVGLRFHWLVIFFIIKILAGEFAFLIYTYSPYFIDSSDAFKFFRDGKVIYESFFDDPYCFFSLMLGINLQDVRLAEYMREMVSWNRVYDTGMFNDNRSMIRFNALVYFISFGYYQVHLVIVNILSFLGLINIYSFFCRKTAIEKRPWLILALFLLPSVVFWGSIVSKEALALFAVGVLVSGAGKISKKENSFSAALLIILGTLMLLLIKLYLLFILLPLVIALVLSEWRKHDDVRPTFLLVLGSFFLLALLLNFIQPAFNPVRWILLQQKDFFGLARYRDEMNPIASLISSSGVLSLLVKSPLALISALLSIFFPPHLNTWTLLAITENMIILSVITWMITGIKQISRNEPVIFFCLLFIIADFLVIGWTTPYAGAIHRYRIISLPFLLCGLAMITAKQPPSFLHIFVKPSCLPNIDGKSSFPAGEKSV